MLIQAYASWINLTNVQEHNKTKVVHMFLLVIILILIASVDQDRIQLTCYVVTS